MNSNTLRWNGGSASIPVTLPANSYYTLQTTVHFIADQNTSSLAAGSYTVRLVSSNGKVHDSRTLVVR